MKNYNNYSTYFENGFQTLNFLMRIMENLNHKLLFLFRLKFQ